LGIDHSRTAGTPDVSRAALLGLSGAALALFAVLWIVTISNRPGTAFRSSHGEPHRILLAEFNNHTDDPGLATRLRDTFQEQLGIDRFANVVPADQIAGYLRLMRKPAGAPIDAAIAREVSLRDGAIDAFVIGAVDRIESRYVASFRVLTPAEAVVVASFSARAATPAELLDEVRREITSLQLRLDAAMPHEPALSPLPRVTTASLRALELYAEAAKLMDHVPIKTGPAFELLREAVRIDPDFASAHILAAWSLRNAGQPQALQLPHAERAFELADTTSDAERYFILGSYYQLTLEVDKAIAAFEALLRLDPTHYWALGNLGRLYRAVGRNDAASELRARQVAIRPQHFWGNFRLAESLFLQGDLKGSEEYAVRAASQISDRDPGDLQSRRSWLEILPACKAWLRDDVGEALRIVDDLESTLTERHGADRDAMSTALGYMYLALGRRQAADRTFRRLPQSADRLYHLAVLGSHFGDEEPVRQYFQAQPDPTRAAASFHGFPTLDGRWSPPTSGLLDRWTKSLDAADASLASGQVALMQGRTAEARRLLQESIDLREDRSGTPALLALVGIAQALRLSGDVPQAIHTLEEASRNRYPSCLWPTASAHLWVQLRTALGQLYRQVDRHADAIEVETQLRTLLAVADDDHPVLARLRRDAIDGTRPKLSPN
jgi:tetratricopeptide (TPR) repeat protein